MFLQFGVRMNVFLRYQVLLIVGTKTKSKTDVQINITGMLVFKGLESQTTKAFITTQALSKHGMRWVL